MIILLITMEILNPLFKMILSRKYRRIHNSGYVGFSEKKDSYLYKLIFYV